MYQYFAIYTVVPHSILHINIAEEKCKTRWRSLRDSFARVVREEKSSKRSGSAGGGKHRTAINHLMSFMEPFVSNRQYVYCILHIISFYPGCQLLLRKKNYAERCYATVVCSSVRLSVTFRYADHTGWNT